MNGLIHKIESSHYVATEAQIETLAREQYTASLTVRSIDGTYLRVILVETQSKLGRKTRGRPNLQSQAQVLATAHEKFYPSVLRGVTTPDIATDDSLELPERQRRSLERNRRSAFARSSFSTLAKYVAAGGDLRGLDVTAVSKASLRAAVSPPEPTDKTERQISRAQGALLRAVARRARGDPDAARAAAEAAIEALQAVIDQIEGSEPEASHTPPERVTQRTRVGVPMLNRSA